MPLFPTELSDFWLAEGQEYIREVLADSISKKPSECGFAQAVQRNLRALDTDADIHAALSRYLQRVHSEDRSAYDPHLHNLLDKAVNQIFIPTDVGSRDHESVLLGLGFLDATEANRLRLLHAARASTHGRHRGAYRAKIV